MKILLTGGCGFIGSHLAEKLVQEKHAVTIIDNLSGDKPHVPERTTVIELNVEDSRCETIFRDNSFDCVIHLAYKHLPTGDSNEFGRILHANNMGLSHILNLSHRFKIPKFIHISSVAVYGDNQDVTASEQETPAPKSEMGRRFLTREMIVEDYRKQNLKTVTIRTGIIYGPRQNDKHTNYLHQIYSSVLSKEPLANPVEGKARWDFLHISDLVDGLVRVIENDTSPVLNLTSGRVTDAAELWEMTKGTLDDQEFPLPSDFIDWTHNQNRNLNLNLLSNNNLATFELAWRPKTSFNEGIFQTTQWAVQSSQLQNKDQVDEKKLKSFKLVRGQISHDLESLAAFVLAAILTYFMQYKLQINMDFLILYVVWINVFYGMRQGSTAIALAIIARVWFSFAFESMRAIDLVNDVTSIMYLTMYFIIGISIGYVIDQKRTQESAFRAEIEATKSDLRFVSDLYEKSLDIKSSLQQTIEHYDDSFGKTVSVIRQLDSVEPEFIYLEAAGILAKLLKAGTIHIYSVDKSGHFLRLAAAAGVRRYDKSISRDHLTLVDQAIRDKSIQINRDLSRNEPLLVAPILEFGQPIAILMIDDLEFGQLKTSLVHTVQVMTLLLSNIISRAERYDQAISGQKYFENTTIMKPDVFKKLMDSRLLYDHSENTPVMILETTSQINDYHDFYLDVSKVLRSDDLMGELSPGHVGILLANASIQDLPVVEGRLRKQGISVRLFDRQVNG